MWVTPHALFTIFLYFIWFAVFAQVKFSELTIDMFRMLQALEREPVNLATQSSKPGTLVREDSYTLPVTLYVECF